MKKFFKKHGKKELPLLIGIALFGINKLFSLNNLFLLILSGGIVGSKLVMDIKNEFTKAFNQEESKYIEEEEKEIEEKDFFRDEYVYDLSLIKNETEAEKKYKLALAKQQEKDKSHIKVVRNESMVEEEKILTKEEVMENLAMDIDTYYYVYQLPPFKVKNKHWDILIDKTYNLFLEKGLIKDYDEVIAHINRLVLAEALVEHKESIGIEDYINNLYYLRFYGIKPKESLLVQKEILEEIYKCQIIDLEKVRKRKHQIQK